MSNLKISFCALTILLSFTIASLPVDTFAQNNLKIYDDIGGGNNNNTQAPESNDNTFIYVAGGLLIAGIVAYALFIKKAKPVETDTTASLNSNLIYTEIENPESFNERIEEVKEQIPVDFFFGVKNNEIVLNDKIYSLGLRFKL